MFTIVINQWPFHNAHCGNCSHNKLCGRIKLGQHKNTVELFLENTFHMRRFMEESIITI